jgi:general stress protein YciG
VKANKGFAAMKNKEHQKEIARKGGIAVSGNKDYMATIGRIGGIKSAEMKRARKQKIDS